jgi:hypothetical protein
MGGQRLFPDITANRVGFLLSTVSFLPSRVGNPTIFETSFWEGSFCIAWWPESVFGWFGETVLGEGWDATIKDVCYAMGFHGSNLAALCHSLQKSWAPLD